MSAFTGPRQGFEFDFLAIGSEGSVAFVSSAGFGPVPQAATKNLEVIDAGTASISELEPRFEANTFTQRTGDFSDWVEVARRGLPAFDWSHEARVYELVARPLKPMRFDELPASIRAAASLVSLPGIDFHKALTFEIPPDLDVNE